MRDIKFRAWNEEERAMSKPFSMPYMLLNFCDSDTGIGLHKTLTDEVVMQFTGLKDKNGVEIYEGDIIESYHCTDGLGVHHFINHIVQWSDKFNGWFALNAESKSDNDGSIQLWCHTKANKYSLNVIGNIHQNTELLNEK